MKNPEISQKTEYQIIGQLNELGEKFEGGDIPGMLRNVGRIRFVTYTGQTLGYGFSLAGSYYLGRDLPSFIDTLKAGGIDQVFDGFDPLKITVGVGSVLGGYAIADFMRIRRNIINYVERQSNREIS